MCKICAFSPEKTYKKLGRCKYPVLAEDFLGVKYRWNTTYFFLLFFFVGGGGWLIVYTMVLQITKKANPCGGKSLRVKQLNTDRCRLWPLGYGRFLFFSSPGRSAKSKRRPKLLSCVAGCCVCLVFEGQTRWSSKSGSCPAQPWLNETCSFCPSKIE